MTKNVVGWFEIPVLDMDRAITFYKTVFGFDFHRLTLLNEDMAFFPSVENGFGSPGALTCSPEFYQPKDNGVLIYFTSPTGDVSVELGKVGDAGGKVVMPRKQISPEYGFIGLIFDSEGNRIGIHSRQ
jgi:hypothetical protein